MLCLPLLCSSMLLIRAMYPATSSAANSSPGPMICGRNLYYCCNVDKAVKYRMIVLDRARATFEYVRGLAYTILDGHTRDWDGIIMKDSSSNPDTW